MSVYVGSRYASVDAYTTRGTKILKLRNRMNFDLSNATFYTVIQGDTIDGIAYKQYGDAAYWWVILDANPKYQSEVELTPGDIIVIPNISV